jgi:hypothetical protein
MWNVKAHEAKRMCLGVKHIFTNGGKCNKWNPMTPKCIPTLGVALVWDSQMFKALVKKARKHQIEPPRYLWKYLKCRCLKCPCIVYLDLICMSYDQKKG